MYKVTVVFTNKESKEYHVANYNFGNGYVELGGTYFLPLVNILEISIFRKKA